VELPLWLADALSQRNMVTVDLPRGFGAKTRQSLKADAMSVSLRERSQHCFHLCVRASQISNRVEALELPGVARVALAARAKVTLDLASNSVGSDVAATRAQLTDVELAMFERGYDFAKDKLEWRRQRTSRLAVSRLEQGVAARRARAAAMAAEAAGRAAGGGQGDGDDAPAALSSAFASSAAASDPAAGFASSLGATDDAGSAGYDSDDVSSARPGHGRAPSRDAAAAGMGDGGAPKRARQS